MERQNLLRYKDARLRNLLNSKLLDANRKLEVVLCTACTMMI